MICCWIEKPNSKEFKQHLPRIHDFLWVAEDGMKAKVFVPASHYLFCHMETMSILLFIFYNLLCVKLFL
jgi:hypothetical protein